MILKDQCIIICIERMHLDHCLYKIVSFLYLITWLHTHTLSLSLQGFEVNIFEKFPKLFDPSTMEEDEKGM